ncbi:MAG: hypothetical protein H7230_03220 [Candidatus Parcubacteria bacterium]|nr:hypothetical protein [Candidatus Paceibacterota bacterium]
MPTPIQLFDSYQKQIITLDPAKTVISNTLKIYSCGPTVYNYMHIGNLRATWLGDTIARVGKLAGWHTQWISNITDVGHLVDDGDDGEDKLEKGAKRENKNVQDIINFYTDDYLKQCQAIGIEIPTGIMRPKATEYIEEQMILSLELLIADKAYLLEDGIYFDSSNNQAIFGSSDFLITEPLRTILETQAKQRAGQSNQFTDRDTKNTTKNPSDFALWKFVSADSLQKWRFVDFFDAKDVLAGSYREILEKWGCPGWHSECVAMISAIAGQDTPLIEGAGGDSSFSFDPFKNKTVIDLHLGGEDHIDVHHKNEILQSEALGFHLSKYWVHNKFVLVNGKKMSKSLGNVFLVVGKYADTGFYSLENPPQEVQDKFKIKGFDPLAYRLMLMEHHYTQQMDFTWDKLAQSQARLFNLRKLGTKISKVVQNINVSISDQDKGLPKMQEYNNKLISDLVNNLNFPLFLEVVTNEMNRLFGSISKSSIKGSYNKEHEDWDLSIDNLDEADFFHDFAVLIDWMDKGLLNLNLFDGCDNWTIETLAIQRQQAKEVKNWAEADRLRVEIAKLGYQVDDYPWGYGLWWNPTLMD